MKDKIAKLQQEIGKISKDTENPFYHSKYFDINTLIEKLNPLLEKHGLMLIQPIINGCVYSIIRDLDSDEEMQSNLCLPDIQDPQKIGSAITYYRRYTLASLLALQAEDDDANATVRTEAKAEDDKKWLNEGTKEFEDCKKAMSEGFKLADIRKKYKVSKKIAELLEN